ncbi:MAG: hypothetical protein Q4F13_02825 [Pseudomonadota bacterium]|nr:hypothetical protein [Pseudomonadota bacterium]
MPGHWHTPVKRRSEADADAAPLHARASGMLLAATLLARTADVPHVTLRRFNSDGTYQQARVSGHLREVLVRQRTPQKRKQEEVPVVQGRLVWLPQGLVLTPRSKSGGAPDGWGLPPTEDGKGAPGGPLREVLLNTFAGNQYPHAVWFAGKPAEPGVPFIESAPLFLMDWEFAQAPRGVGQLMRTDDPAQPTQWVPQLGKNRRPQWAEPSSGRWHCHRPQLAAESRFAYSVRMLTNALREEKGVPPLGPPVQGYRGTLSNAVVYAMAASGIVGHDSRLFPKGYESAQWRNYRRTAWLQSFGENIASSNDGADVGAAAVFVDAWRHSPQHYASMTMDWAKASEDALGAPRGTFYAFMDAASSRADVLHTLQLPPYGLDAPTRPFVEPAKNAAAAAQVFTAMPHWVAPGRVGKPVDPDDRVGLVPGEPSGEFFSPFAAGRSDLAVRYRGRTIRLADEADASEDATEMTPHGVYVMGAGLRRPHPDEPPFLRVVILEREGQPSEGRGFVSVWEGLLHDFTATRQRVGRVAIPSNTGLLSHARVSPMGQVVFSAVLLEPHPWVNLFYMRPKADWPDTFVDYSLPEPFNNTEDINARRIWGGKVKLFHWSHLDARWTDTGNEEQLLIEPEFIQAEDGLMSSRERCKGEYRLLADFGGFGGETLQYLLVEVDALALCEKKTSSNNNNQGRISRMQMHLKGALRFADGQRFFFQDVTMRYDYQRQNMDSVSGYVTYLGHVDVLDAQRLVYLRLDLRGTEFPQADAELLVHGKLVASKKDVLRIRPEEVTDNGDSHWAYHRKIPGIGQNDFGVEPPLLRAWVFTNTKGWPDYSGYEGYSGQITEKVLNFIWGHVQHPPIRSHTPRLAMPVTVMTHRSGEDYGTDSPGRLASAQRSPMIFDMVGPRFMCDGFFQSPMYAQMEFHEGEWLAGVYLGASPVRQPGNWFDKTHYHASSLDLKDLVGAALDGNVFPMGVV